MFKNVAILFLVVYPLYVVYSRQPDYFDGEMNRAIIHHVYDSVQKKDKEIAVYTIAHQPYSINASYPFTSLAEGEKVKIIYEVAAPENASIYRIWGYWIRWKELLSFIVLFAALYFVAVSITSHPTPEALIEEIEGDEPKPRRRKYDL